ncbi:hypothetical protein JOF29_006199 [Kribbella aluminosa]|uniref:Uncharacterized protein n=1 Tax=Kribbella aluminosa TaxID=416017 RepID=A0ABS4UU53_9ACTN|nr:hypothetical protein [Kribbella aluminosa]
MVAFGNECEPVGKRDADLAGLGAHGSTPVAIRLKA